MSKEGSGEIVYGEPNAIQINNETYQLQSVEFEDETFFLVKSLDKVICMIMKNEKGEWDPDCYISHELIEQILEHIYTLED
jgi:hypothetical protein